MRVRVIAEVAQEHEKILFSLRQGKGRCQAEIRVYERDEVGWRPTERGVVMMPHEWHAFRVAIMEFLDAMHNLAPSQPFPIARDRQAELARLEGLSSV